MAVNSKYLSMMSAAVIAAATLGAGNVHAQSSSKGDVHGKTMGEACTNTMEAAGRTQANREGRMSPAGQNATSSIDATGKHNASKTSGASSSGKTMGEAGSNTMDAAGKTQANREGRMSPTGQNATSSVAPKTGMPAGK